MYIVGPTVCNHKFSKDFPGLYFRIEISFQELPGFQEIHLHVNPGFILAAVNTEQNMLWLTNKLFAVDHVN